MKTSLIIGLLLLSVWSSFAQDTSFIFKNTANGVYHVIFIEQKPDSKYYDWIAGYGKTEKQEEFDGFDKVDFAKWIGKK